MKAIILAGGFGTELKSIVKDVPKPMVLIAGKPFLEHLIMSLKEQKITDIIITVHHMSYIIKSYFGDGRRLGVNITYSEEEVPLGTAGAIKNAEKYIMTHSLS
jgi:NDP-sugar pyrophosphorylase family protein